MKLGPPLPAFLWCSFSFLDSWFTQVSDFLKTGAVPWRKMLISDILLVDGSYPSENDMIPRSLTFTWATKKDVTQWCMIHVTCRLLYGSVFVSTGRKQSSVRMMRLDMWWTSMPWHIKKWGKRWALKGSIKVFFSIFAENESLSYKYFEICKWQPNFGCYVCLILALSNSGC